MGRRSAALCVPRRAGAHLQGLRHRARATARKGRPGLSRQPARVRWPRLARFAEPSVLQRPPRPAGVVRGGWYATTDLIRGPVPTVVLRAGRRAGRGGGRVGQGVAVSPGFGRVLRRPPGTGDVLDEAVPPRRPCRPAACRCHADGAVLDGLGQSERDRDRRVRRHVGVPGEVGDRRRVAASSADPGLVARCGRGADAADLDRVDGRDGRRGADRDEPSSTPTVVFVEDVGVGGGTDGRRARRLVDLGRVRQDRGQRRPADEFAEPRRGTTALGRQLERVLPPDGRRARLARHRDAVVRLRLVDRCVGRDRDDPRAGRNATTVDRVRRADRRVARAAAADQRVHQLASRSHIPGSLLAADLRRRGVPTAVERAPVGASPTTGPARIGDRCRRSGDRRRGRRVLADTAPIHRGRARQDRADRTAGVGAVGRSDGIDRAQCRCHDRRVVVSPAAVGAGRSCTR